MTTPRTRPLKVGLILPHLEGWYQGGTARWEDLAAMARTAEDVGLNSLWVADHLLYRFPQIPTFGIWECWSLMAGLAASTSRVELGTIVTVTGWRNPGLFAKMVDTVDEISGGRVILGLGAGSHEPEFPAFGYDHWHQRVSRFAEEIEIIHTLLRTGSIDHEGKYYTLRECELRPRGPRPQGPPIMVGALGPRMLRLLARFADDWNIPWRQQVEQVTEQYPRGEEACQEVGRDFASLSKSVCLQVDLPNRDDFPNLDWIRGARANAIGGTREQVAETLRGYASAGVSHVQLWLDPSNEAGVEELGRVLEVLDTSGA